MTERRLWIQWPASMLAREVRLLDADTNQEIGYRVVSMDLHINPNNDRDMTATLTFVADDNGDPLSLQAKVRKDYKIATSEWVVAVMNFEPPRAPKKPEQLT